MAVALRTRRSALAALPENERYGGETDARQVFDRLAGTWTYWGWKGGYFTTEEDAQRLLRRAPLHARQRRWRRRTRRSGSTPACTGPTASTAPARATTTSITRPASCAVSTSAYEHPQPHACFIQSVADDLVNEGGIMDLWVREARLFKYGSGTGSNFSALRGAGEKLSGGGTSSGLMSFLKIGDRAAGAIKSGGTTRRAAKMVVVDVDHPDIEEYINWKVTRGAEGRRARDRLARSASKRLQGRDEGLRQLRGADGEACFDPPKNPALKRAIREATTRRRAAQLHPARHPVRQAGLHGDRVRHLRHRLGQRSLPHGLRPELQQLGARHRRVPERRRADDGDWNLTRPHSAARSYEDAEGARPVGPDRLRRLGLAPIPASSSTRRSTTGTPARRSGRSAPRTRARSTCSSTTRRATSRRSTCCASAATTESFDIDAYRARLPAVDDRARNLRADGAVPVTPDRRAELPLSHARSRLRQHRRPADVGRHALRLGRRPRHLRRHLGHHDRRLVRHQRRDGGRARTVPRLRAEAADMLRVIRNHRRAAYGAGRAATRSWRSRRCRSTTRSARRDARLVDAARRAWDRALELGQEHGYRNAQATVVAPTGTIGLVMDCDTTGIEPDFALVKFKKLAGGGYFKIINQSVPAALAHARLPRERDRRDRSLRRRPRLAGSGARRSTPRRSRRKGFTDDGAGQDRAGSRRGLRHQVRVQPAGRSARRSSTDTLRRPGGEAQRSRRSTCSRISASRRSDIEAANEHVCGAMTLEGAPHLKAEHLPGVRLRQPVRPQGQALSLASRATSA